MKIIKKVKKKNGCRQLYFLGVKFFSYKKRKTSKEKIKEELTKITAEIEHTKKIFKQIIKKLSMEDNIWCIGNTLFYVPNYPLDLIQSAIVNEDKYYEMDILQDLDKYIPDNAVIFDVGANIGNHSLYWAIERRAKKIYAFEPVAQIFKMLTKNIAINNLENVVEPLNIGLSNVKTKGRVSGFWQDNIAKTQVEGSQFGSLNLDMLDNIDIAESKIDFIKIDVEEHEILTLNGALKTLSKYRPLIFIESFDPHIVEVRKIMDNLGYKLIKEYPGSNYLFAHKEKSKGLI